jgi:hypothetical protein
MPLLTNNLGERNAFQWLEKNKFQMEQVTMKVKVKVQAIAGSMFNPHPRRHKAQ